MSKTQPSSPFLQWFLIVSVLLGILGGGYRLVLARRQAAHRAVLQTAYQVDDATVRQNVRFMVTALWRIEAESSFPFSPAQAGELLPLLKKAEKVEALSTDACQQLIQQMRWTLSPSQNRLLKAINMNVQGILEEAGLKAKDSGQPAEPTPGSEQEGEAEEQETEEPLSPDTASFEEILADLIERLESKGKDKE